MAKAVYILTMRIRNSYGDKEVIGAFLCKRVASDKGFELKEKSKGTHKVYWAFDVNELPLDPTIPEDIWKPAHPVEGLRTFTDGQWKQGYSLEFKCYPDCKGCQ